MSANGTTIHYRPPYTDAGAMCGSSEGTMAVNVAGVTCAECLRKLLLAEHEKLLSAQSNNDERDKRVEALCKELSVLGARHEVAVRELAKMQRAAHAAAMALAHATEGGSK